MKYYRKMDLMPLFLIPIAITAAFYFYSKNRNVPPIPQQKPKISTQLKATAAPVVQNPVKSNFFNFSFDSILSNLKNTIGTSISNGTTQNYYPVAPQNISRPSYTPNALLELIGKHESNGNYNIAYGGRTVNFTSMSVNQVLEWQARNNPAGAATAAAGKYQIIRKTLLGLKAKLGLSGNEVFNKQLQDKMAIELLNQRGLQNYLKGSLSENSFMLNISKEWASFPRDFGGQSYYAGDGINKAGVTPNAVIAALRTIKNQA